MLPERVSVPLFGGAEIPLGDLDDGWQVALSAFLGLPAEAGQTILPHLVGFNRDIAANYGFAPLDRDAIWQTVAAQEICVVADDGRMVVAVYCDCDWLPERGLLLVWQDGVTLTRVSGIDGHLSNSYAYNDPALADAVYVGIDRAFTTRR